MSSTFQDFGGFSAVSRIVMTFYEKVLYSDVVGHHFDDVDMPRLMDHQTKFVAALMGGPTAMTDDRLAHVHRHLNISPEEFDEIVKLLSDAMRDHQLPDTAIKDVARAFNAKRALIVQAQPA